MAEPLLDQLKKQEGLMLFPYQDRGGTIAIGYGRNLTRRGISQEEADLMLTNDINLSTQELISEFPWVTTLDDARRNVLIDMCFNMGITTLKGFKATMGAVQAGNYQLAAQYMLDSLWAKQVGKRATDLAAIMESGA